MSRATIRIRMSPGEEATVGNVHGSCGTYPTLNLGSAHIEFDSVHQLREIAECMLAWAKREDPLPEDEPNGPPWLSDAAKALGEVAPDGSPLALNWNQVLEGIAALRRANRQLEDELSDCQARLMI